MDTIFDRPTDNKVMVIGEIAQAHDGSLGNAHAFIDAIADAGADARLARDVSGVAREAAQRR